MTNVAPPVFAMLLDVESRVTQQPEDPYVTTATIIMTNTHVPTSIFVLLMKNVDHCLSSPCIHCICINNQTSYICNCSRGWKGDRCETNAYIGIDCLDLHQSGLGYTNGVYSVRLNKSGEVIKVFCDMTSDGGGWTLFQKRFNGSVDFYRNFSEYDDGFGSVYGEFWLGLKYIYQMTVGVENELRLDLEKANGATAFEVYQHFSLSAYPLYTLHIGAYSGTASDGGQGLSSSNGYPFSTYYQVPYNCPVNYHGSWWYFMYDCAYVNLNGDYMTIQNICFLIEQLLCSS